MSRCKNGLSLGDIKRLFDRKPVDLGALLGAQRGRLASQAQEIADAITLIDSALSRIDRGDPLDAATFCSLIRDGEEVMTNQANARKAVIDRYCTTEEQTEWREHMADAPTFSSMDYLEQWSALSGRIEAALPLDPASDTALAFVCEWFTLLEPFSRNATPAMWKGSARMYADMVKWEGKVDTSFSKQVWDFINAAASAARDAGRDIGPVPSFVQSGS